MSSSILNDVKKVIGLVEEYDYFDKDITLHINAALSTLHDLGVGPPNFYILDGGESTWSLLGIDEPYLSMVKEYLYLKVRLVFDPPPTSYAIDSLTKMADQLEWRLHIVGESVSDHKKEE